MPVHSVAANALTSTIEELEKTERIVQVVPAGDGAYHVITEPKPSKRKPANEVETR